ncbi:uncharacterized protein LOC129263814 [Lytechinus pictus]|uniref:uncharacterized protein LOC129263814 n=1 Tax=Lytechinus pictus TaxID=7653 RepID=UPI0030B9B494
MRKGYFPHLFNTKVNQGYQGPIPPKKYFDPEGMKEDGARKKFEEWYIKQANVHYNLEEEMLAYCHSDVDILMRGCMSFRDSFIEASGIDPFKDDVTIASVCSRVYRTNFLPEETIALIPPQGYTPKHNHSLKAMCWLKWLSYTRGVDIQHALNGGEARIGNYLADGFDGTKVYDFYGCLWHGCTTCFKRRDILVPGTADTVESVYHKTIERERAIRNKGYTVEVIWEHDFQRQLKENADFFQFFKVFKETIRTPLDPRDAFYGGRTGASRLYYKSSKLEKIGYVDVCSLYPWVNKVGKYPVGHPQIITENFSNIEEYEGLIKCQLFPPRKLYHPVIPYRPPGTSSKLMFALCRTCAIEKQQTPCTHTEKERMMEGTWVTDEVKLALSKGYTMGKIFEVWHFSETTQYDPESKTGGLFSGYINTFLKVKQEASGWPAECRFPGDEEGLPVPENIRDRRERYLREYLEKEGVKLDPENIKHNPGLRAVAKSALNCMWGKMGQRGNLAKAEYFTDPGAFYQRLTDETREVLRVDFPTDQVAKVVSVPEEDFETSLGNTNVVVAAYTTAQARLKLYSYLDILQDRVLYYDTDSVIFVDREGAPKVETGNFLGDMTDELECYGEGSFIEEFCSGGSKNYAYRVYEGESGNYSTVCKVRGITLNLRNKRVVNFESLKSMVCDGKAANVITDPRRIARTRNGQLVTRTEQKAHRVVFDKRVKMADYNTLPYGY